MPRPKSDKTDILNLRCSRELLAALDLCAAREGEEVTRSEMARRLLQEAVERRLDGRGKGRRGGPA